MSVYFFRPDRAELEDDLVFLEVRTSGRPLDAPTADAPLPGWLDLVLCVAAPVLVALVVLLVFRLGAVVSAGA